MKRETYLGDDKIKGFVEWLSNKANTLKVSLDITPSPRVPGGVKCKVTGLAQVLERYKWKAVWTDSNNKDVVSEDWPSTALSLEKLRRHLSQAVSSDDEIQTFLACAKIFQWGGERNRGVGARPFLDGKCQSKDLVGYLKKSKMSFRLCSADLSKLDSIELVNSMMTKVYALHADDGLPIYDSRVAAAISALVEIYRRQSQRNWTGHVPENLAFPVLPGRDNTRNLNGLGHGCLFPKPPYIRHLSNEANNLWASSKIRLGWIIERVLEVNTDIFCNQQYSSRAHAFEASLFMLGYDIGCLKQELFTRQL